MIIFCCRILALEREKGTHIYSKRSDFRNDFSQLEEIDRKQTTERKTEQIKLKQQLEKISHMVKRFHMELRDVKPTPESSARDITKDLPPEVAAYEKFLEQTGGLRGGWDEYDHQTFLKFRQRYQGRQIFLTHLLPAIPTKTEEEINDHEEWYQEYLFLNDRKKDSIKKWRKKKEEEKDDMMSHVGQEEEEEKEDAKLLKYKEQIEMEKRERFSQLNAYKMEVKARVEEHKQRRLQEQELIRQEEELWEREQKERQRQLSARELVKFRERDQKIVQKKIIKAKTKEEELKEKEKRLERLKGQVSFKLFQVEVEVERDPNRLLKPTAGWKQRTKEIGPSGSGPVLHMPHR
ncbi:hypothetical protein KUTeg_018428 [Tegillarca granosa]|uniref:Coiled-coil domain-containing protein 112 n=1 Tax=Tegillarca granosa TaxID=220873 RepID=A0ABQ9EN72_TEGGR|nr:hypothetical protein KUTeg_018428 [Tegillarca granosa]